MQSMTAVGEGKAVDVVVEMFGDEQQDIVWKDAERVSVRCHGRA